MATSLVETFYNLLTTESSKYIGEMPDSPDVCSVVTPTGGYNPNYSMNKQTPSISYPTFQIMLRDSSYDAGYKRAEAIIAAISGKVSSNLCIYQQSDILGLGKDEQGRSLFSINFKVMVT